ncbi:hypothetical protein [Candidatus Soleaferrea massiliensis]|uniref:hypothetical protein n=1 Tax=Candidatus Soleaferrea massiliensis TaxID=1470354 RepID=UPI0030B9A320
MAADQESFLDGTFFKSVLDSMNTNVYITDVETDEIVYMNDAMKKPSIWSIRKAVSAGRSCRRVWQNGAVSAKLTNSGRMTNGKAVCGQKPTPQQDRILKIMTISSNGTDGCITFRIPSTSPNISSSPKTPPWMS